MHFMVLVNLITREHGAEKLKCPVVNGQFITNHRKKFSLTSSGFEICA